MTRQYTEQNMQFTAQHKKVKQGEASKREEIESNFENHISQINHDMKKELKHTNEETIKIQLETSDLNAKYESLKQECEEKMVEMAKTLEENETKQAGIEQSLDEQIKVQCESIKEQKTVWK